MGLLELRTNYIQGKISKREFIDQAFLLHQNIFEYVDYLKESGISKIIIDDQGVVMHTRHTDIDLITDTHDARTCATELLNLGYNEKFEFDMVAKLISKNAMVLDIGANCGIFSLSLIKRDPTIKIIAIEPVPEIYNSFLENLMLNNVVKENIDIRNFGFADYIGTSKFYYYPFETGNSSMVNHKNSSQAEVIEIPIYTVDSVISKEKFKVDFIKCDVEGAELLVFKGAKKTLIEQKPIIMAEMLRIFSKKFGYHPNDLIEYLEQLGYRCFTAERSYLKKFTIMDEQTTDTNFIFLHRQKHTQLITMYEKVI